MIPADPEELNALAGEYVLGTLDARVAREVEAALSHDAALREAVLFWENRLHPLSRLSRPASPPPGVWDAIDARIRPPTGHARFLRWWDNPVPWRWASASLAAVAAALIVVVALPRHQANFAAVLSSPAQEHTTGFIASGSGDTWTLRAVAGVTPPPGRAFEAWLIAPHDPRPRPLGVVPHDGALHLAKLDASSGSTLAISIEPPGGSPTGLPTGPVVYAGAVTQM